MGTFNPRKLMEKAIDVTRQSVVEPRADGKAVPRTLAALRDTLLPKLISGELRVPQAERLIEGAV